MVNKTEPEMIGWYFIDRDGVQIKYLKDGVWPSTYLLYAERDYKEYERCKDVRHLINSVSNAKRALHYQVESLSCALGWNLIKSRKDFPSRLEFLGRCGVLSPTVIKRINRLRNTVEHDYYTPTDGEALEYLEIVELYLAATHGVSTYFPSNITVDIMDCDEEYDAAWGLPGSIDIKIPEGKGRIVISCDDGVIVDVDIKDEAYYSWVYAVMKQASN